jgi:hypothetical protein
MRIRITQPLDGSIDGIQLSRFRQGEIYDVSSSLGSYLLCERLAETVSDEEPALVLPLDDVRSSSATDDDRSGRTEAADRPTKRLPGAKGDGT